MECCNSRIMVRVQPRAIKAQICGAEEAAESARECKRDCPPVCNRATLRRGDGHGNPLSASTFAEKAPTGSMPMQEAMNAVHRQERDTPAKGTARGTASPQVSAQLTRTHFELFEDRGEENDGEAAVPVSQRC